METPALPKGIVRRAFGPMPFARQVQTHTLSNAADALFAVSLAGSLFFNVSVDAARPRIILYLVLTMAPFAVIAPIIGPVIDRVPGGHRLVVSLTCFLRAAVCVVMAGHLRTLSFYPEAFTVLVLGKTYSVAKSALVPRIVTDPADLVAANSRLSRLGTVGAAIGGGIGAAVLNVAAAPWTLRIGALAYLLAGLVALSLPRPQRAPKTVPALEREEVHAPRIVLASTAMAALRAAVGFTMFLLAFALRGAGEPTWLYGAVLAAGGAGGFLGTFAAPVLRRHTSEVQMLALALAVPAALALIAAAGYSRITAVAVSLGIGVGANVGRQAFDSLVQHDAPDADRGRVFARFETRFQLAWVLGALIPVATRPPPSIGMLGVGVILVVGAIFLVSGTRAAERHALLPAGVRVRDVLAVTDDSPVAVHLLLTAERLAGEGLYDQAVVIAGAAADAFPGVDPATRASLARLHGRTVAGEPVGARMASEAIATVASALASVVGGDGYAAGSRSTTSQSSPTRSTT